MAIEPPHSASPLPSGASLPTHPQTGLGVWLRRYRRYVPIPLVVIGMLWLRPIMPGGSPLLETLLDVVGVLVCMLGQWFRLWAWGSNATVGKWGVRDRGPYALLQHPLYTGNFLIAAGVVIVFNHPWGYVLFLAPLAYLYYVITDMEEQRMQRRFGAEYHHYRERETPRFLPALSNLGAAVRTTRPFGWRFAWRKEYESCCGWIAGIAALQAYEGICWRGWEANWPSTVRWLTVASLIVLPSLVFGIPKSVRRIKQRRQRR